MFTMLFLKKIYIQLFNQNLNVIHERDTELTILCDVNNACAMFLWSADKKLPYVTDTKNCLFVFKVN